MLAMCAIFQQDLAPSKHPGVINLTDIIAYTSQLFIILL